MLVGLKNKFLAFITLFGIYNVVEPILTKTLYDSNNVLLLAVSIVAFAGLVVRKLKNGASANSMLWTVFIIAFSFLILMADGVLSFGYYTKWVLFAFALLFYIVTIDGDEAVSDGVYKLIFFAVCIQVVFFIYNSFDASAYEKLRSGTYLKLCFENKNATAIHLLTLCCISVLYAERLKAKKEKLKIVLPMLAFAICFYFIIKTGSRSAIMGALFVLLFFALPKLKRYVTRPVLLLIILTPFIFAAVYIAIYKAGYADLQFMGRKLFNGREDLWMPVFEADWSEWLFGMYSKYTRIGAPPFQLHNGTVDMIASYGIIVTGMFLAMIYSVLSKLLKTKNDTNRMIVICLCAIIVETVGEAALFMGGARSIYICMIFAFIAKNTVSDTSLNDEIPENKNNKKKLYIQEKQRSNKI